MASRKIWCTDTHGRTSQYLRCLSTISGGGYICYGRQFTMLTSILLLLFSLYSIGGGHLFFVVLSLLCCVVYSALGACLCFIAFYRAVLKSVPSSGRFLVIRVNIIHGRRRWEQHIFKREWFMIFTYYYSNEDIFQPTFYPQSSSLYMANFLCETFVSSAMQISIFVNRTFLDLYVLLRLRPLTCQLCLYL